VEDGTINRFVEQNPLPVHGVKRQVIKNGFVQNYHIHYLEQKFIVNYAGKLDTIDSRVDEQRDVDILG
jgi:hypothetical protein